MCGIFQLLLPTMPHLIVTTTSEADEDDLTSHVRDVEPERLGDLLEATVVLSGSAWIRTWLW